MKGSEFLRRVKRLAAARRRPFAFRPDRGKGSHGRVYLGSEFTTVKNLKKEIGLSLLAKMCRDLGIEPHDL